MKTPKTGSWWVRLGVVLLLVLTAAGVSAHWWYTQARTADVDYQQCQIQYGEIVTQWDGSGQEGPWNDDRYHYQARRFSLRAQAPPTFFPNTVESPPTRVATGGKHACQDGFDETVNVREARYRWHGSRATAMRLGMPATAPDAESAFVSGAADASSSRLTTPVFQQSQAAAVWVNDGGSALLSQDGQLAEWWCINGRRCGDITEQTFNGRPIRGGGYQYVADNCPSHITCNGSWYTQVGTPQVLGYSQQMLSPFQMRLSATSTYAGEVGAAVVATFKYPKQVNLQTSISQQPDSLIPGETSQLNLTIHKQGPALDGLSLASNRSDQLITYPSAALSQKQLRRLNTQDSVTVPVSLHTREAARPGSCYKVQFSFTAPETDTPIAEPETTQCIAARQRTINYQVRTRGEIASDLPTFTSRVAATLEDPRGWAAGNITFERVPRGGDFTLWLAAPAAVAEFSSGCSAEYSCRVGSQVIINDSRWQKATPAWRRADGSLRNYRHMVINHEVGHFLGLGHRGCPGTGRPAPVMMQQSISLDGCRFQPWPLPGEIERVTQARPGS
jgi:hypothetical protein